MALVHIVRPVSSRPLSSFFMHLGLTILHEALREEEFDIEIIDLAFRSEQNYLDSVAEKPPEFVMMSLMIDNFKSGIDLAAQLKRLAPSTKIVIGGPHTTTIGDRSLKVAGQVDIIGIGDCIPEVLDALRTCPANGRLVIRPNFKQQSFSPIFAAAYQIWDRSRYFPVYPVELARGCRYRCPFCSDPALRPNLQHASWEVVLSILSDLCTENGRTFVRFADSSFTSLGEPLNKLLEGIIALQLPLRWGAYAYAADITPELARTLRRSGCEALFVGVESLSAEVITGKRFQKNPARVSDAVNMLRDEGIHVHCNLIAGLPGESEDTLLRTVQALIEIAPDSVGGGPFYLTPDTTFHNRMKQFGIEILDSEWIEKLHYSFNDPSYEYFRVQGMRQIQMRVMAEQMRRLLEENGLRWNLSDYAFLCWRSVGGTRDQLYRLWKEESGEASSFIDILKEKRGGILTTERASEFVMRLTTQSQPTMLGENRAAS